MLARSLAELLEAKCDGYWMSLLPVNIKPTAETPIRHLRFFVYQNARLIFDSMSTIDTSLSTDRSAQLQIS